MTSRPDPRVARGTARMLALQQAEVSGGATRLGWKVGFGSPSALASLGTDRPLVGFLTRDRLLDDEAVVSLAGWTKPVLEAEVAAYLGSDVGAGASPSQTLAAVAGWSVAIELADLDRPPSDVEEILAGNIYHRHVALGPVVATRPAPLSFVVLRVGDRVATTSSPEEHTGELGTVLASTADTLASCGERLRAGDVVITGSVVPPLPVQAGAWTVSAAGLGEISVALTC